MNGKWQPVFKDPVTDPGKNSKHGRLALVESEPGEFHTMENVHGAQLDNEDRLVTVFENGKVLVNYDLDSIRDRAQILMGVPQGTA
jgi:nicotinamide phosphoribosyltransferase